MDVRRFALVLFFIALAACQKQKTVPDVFNGKTSGQNGLDCPTESLIKNQFLVSYEDGRFEIIHSENAATFEKHFLLPHLQEVKRVEYNSIVRINSENEINEQAADVNPEAIADWGQPAVKADSAWSQNVYGEGVTVAVVDASVDYSHPQLTPRLAPNLAEINGVDGVDDDGNGYIDDKYGWDFYGNKPQPTITAPLPDQHPNEHGTHVAGVILADHSAGDVKGLAPKAQLVPINFMDEDGGGNIGHAILAIKYAKARGAKIINASWGGGGCNQLLKEAISEVEKSTLFVAAAGNDGYDFDRVPVSKFSYPAVFNVANQLTVASAEINNTLSDFSNKSWSLVHLAAPGRNIRSTVPYVINSAGSDYLSGTSMATPFVSGAAALLWSAKPNATVAQIRQALLNSVDIHAVKVSSGGTLNVEKALTEIRRIVP
jgi:subtilisin family serine protease